MRSAPGYSFKSQAPVVVAQNSLVFCKARVAMLREMGLPVQLWEARLNQTAQRESSGADKATRSLAHTVAQFEPPPHCMGPHAQADGAASVRPIVTLTQAPRVPSSTLHGHNSMLPRSGISNQQLEVAAQQYPPRALGEVAAIAQLAEPDLSLHIQACRACSLCQTRRQALPGVGARVAEIVILGEAPSEQEDMQGEPFVGAEGQLLDNMLLAVRDVKGVKASRQDHVFIAHAIKCRVPGNRNPLESELAACAPYWQRQIEVVQPKVILALGRFAAQAVLGDTAPLGRLRDQVHRYRDIPVIVSYALGYLLRNPSAKGKAWADLCLLMQTWHALQTAENRAVGGAGALLPAPSME